MSQLNKNPKQRSGRADPDSERLAVDRGPRDGDGRRHAHTRPRAHRHAQRGRRRPQSGEGGGNFEFRIIIHICPQWQE